MTYLRIERDDPRAAGRLLSFYDDACFNHGGLPNRWQAQNLRNWTPETGNLTMGLFGTGHRMVVTSGDSIEARVEHDPDVARPEPQARDYAIDLYG